MTQIPGLENDTSVKKTKSTVTPPAPVEEVVEIVTETPLPAPAEEAVESAPVTPTETKTPYRMAKVTAGALNCRSKPDKNATVVTVFKLNEELEISEARSDSSKELWGKLLDRDQWVMLKHTSWI